jgi:hypothetical protein
MAPGAAALVEEDSMANFDRCTGGEDCALTYCARLLKWAAEWQIAEYQRGGVRMHPSLEALHELHQIIHIAICPRTRSLDVPLIARCYALAQSFPEPARGRLSFLIWLELGRSNLSLPAPVRPRTVVTSAPLHLERSSAW